MKADEERFELSTYGLTNHCSAIELFIHVGPERLELSTPGVKDRYSDPIELRTNTVMLLSQTIPDGLTRFKLVSLHS
jgi:hypothetical protein